MARRMRKKIDKRVFKHTADQGKSINIAPPNFRGGIRF